MSIDLTLIYYRYHQGKFEASRENYLEGYVSCGAYDKQVLIRGLKHLNRAVHEDVVAIEVFPKSQWVGASSTVQVRSYLLGFVSILRSSPLLKFQNIVFIPKMSLSSYLNKALSPAVG